jgi:hypothetical protein
MGNPRASLAAGLLFLALTATACGGNDDDKNSSKAPAAIDRADFSATVDNRLVPLSSVSITVFKGSERGDKDEKVETRAENRVLKETEQVAGVPVTAVEVKEYENGELAERTLDYYAQRSDGSVWYFGERVNNYEDGKIANHEGQWLAGKGNATPGLFMPVKPQVGQAFEQERAPGVAEDRSTVVAVGLHVITPAGKFDDCIKTKDFSPLDKVSEFKYYCAGVGLVREQEQAGRADLVRYR